MTKVYVRADPLRVVVKPYPREMGGGLNQFELSNKGQAMSYARRLADEHGWTVEDETHLPPAKPVTPMRIVKPDEPPKHPPGRKPRG